MCEADEDDADSPVAIAVAVADAVAADFKMALLSLLGMPTLARAAAKACCAVTSNGGPPAFLEEGRLYAAEEAEAF